MSKTGAIMLVLLGAALGAMPAMAQDDSGFDIRRGGGEEKATTATKLDKVLGWETSDGAFKLKLENRVQFRLTGNNEVGDGENGTNGRDFWNFRIRRVKTTFSGHIFKKEFQYKVTMAWQASANELVETATFTWAAHELINIMVGQDKLPWNWQEYVSSGKQMFVDRSVANEFFNQDFAKGITLSGAFKSDEAIWIRYYVGVYNGVLKGNGDFRNADVLTTADGFKSNSVSNSGGVDSDLMFNLRLETHPLGEVAHDMVDGRGEDKFDKPLFAIGLGLNWFASDLANADLRPTSVAGATASGRARASQDTLAFTIDGHFRWHGLSVDLEYYWRHTELHYQGAEVGKNGAALGFRQRPTNMDERGFTAEVGYFILPKEFQVGLRFSMVDGEDFYFGGQPSAGLLPDATEMGLVVGYFLYGHNLKIQTDVTYTNYQLVDFRTGAPREPVARIQLQDRSASSRANDVSDNLGVWQWRVQIQWIF